MNIIKIKKHNSAITGELSGYLVTFSKTYTDENGDEQSSEVISDVPHSVDNTDYQKILQWVADGNTIQEAD
mgnify:CR=1 FL=1